MLISLGNKMVGKKQQQQGINSNEQQRRKQFSEAS